MEAHRTGSPHRQENIPAIPAPGNGADRKPACWWIGGAEVRNTPDETYWFFAGFLPTPHSLPPSPFLSGWMGATVLAAFMDLAA
jgi:hypothetical protein